VFGKIVSILLAVLFVVSLSASAVAACAASSNSAAPLSGLGTGSADPLSTLGLGNGLGTGCDSCGACNNGACGSACDSCSACDTCHACNHGCCCKAKEPTWEDWFNAFKNDGFDFGNGINFAGLLNL
jgi:hypothetical protein